MPISKPTSAIFGMLLICAAAFPQSGSDLRRKYGPPAEAYEVRPNVMMTVVFGADGQACEMVIEARHTSKAGVNGNDLIPSSIAEEILNEVAPKERRGKGGRAITFSGGCSSITSEEYENVSIYRSEQCLHGGGKAVLAITVKWRHKECPGKGSGALRDWVPADQMVLVPTDQMVLVPTDQMVLVPTDQMVLVPTDQMVLVPTDQMVLVPEGPHVYSSHESSLCGLRRSPMFLTRHIALRWSA